MAVDVSLRGDTERNIVVEFVGVLDVVVEARSVLDRCLRVGGSLDDIADWSGI